MPSCTRWNQTLVLVILFLALGAIIIGGLNAHRVSARALDPIRLGNNEHITKTEGTTAGSDIFLPVTFRNFPWQSPFGIESTSFLAPGSKLLSKAVDLQAGWVRLNERISWRNLQPNETDPINWSLLASFEDELRAIKAAGLTPVVIVDDYPRWATVVPSSCAPIKPEKYVKFAEFMRQIVAYFKTPEFNVHHWEMGNEPDVDPDVVSVDSVFGCWGDIDDREYYGGRQYGDMLKVVTPAIRTEDPSAKIWLGGLLLDRPNTTDPTKGKPENFIKGVFAAGAAEAFDVLPYHVYPAYINTSQVDQDNGITSNPWYGLGGMYLGKARYLRQVMSSYGVNKPLFVNETSLMCPHYFPYCNPPGEDFYLMQATFLIRSFTRALSENLMGFMWYTLNGPGWRESGLLDKNGDPRNSYIAYQQQVFHLHKTHNIGSVYYGPDIEAYAFERGNRQVIVVWTRNSPGSPVTVPVAESKFVEAFRWDGSLISLVPSAGIYDVPIGFEPIYIIRFP